MTHTSTPELEQVPELLRIAKATGHHNPQALVDRYLQGAALRRDPWANDPDRTTRHHATSVAPPVKR